MKGGWGAGQKLILISLVTVIKGSREMNSFLAKGR